MATFADCRSTPRPLSTNNSFHVNAIHNKKSSRPPLLIVNEVNVFEPKKNRRHKGHYRHSWEHPDRHVSINEISPTRHPEENPTDPSKPFNRFDLVERNFFFPDLQLNYQDFTASDIDVTPLDGLIKMFSISLYPRVFISLHKELLSCDPSTYDEDDVFLTSVVSQQHILNADIAVLPSYVQSVHQLRLPVPEEQLSKWYRCKTRVCHHIENGTECSHYPACWFIHTPSESLENILLRSPPKPSPTKRLNVFLTLCHSNPQID